MNYVESIKKYATGKLYNPWDVPESQLSGELERPSVNTDDARILDSMKGQVIGDFTEHYADEVAEAWTENPNAHGIEVKHCANSIVYKLFGRTVVEFYYTDWLCVDSVEVSEISGNRFDNHLMFED